MSHLSSVESYRERVLSLYSNTNLEQIPAIIQILYDLFESDGTLYVLGNGGSYTTTSHFVADMTIGNQIRNRKVLRVLNLFDNTSNLTAASIDVSFVEAAELLVKSYMVSKDSLLVLSASGESENLVRAIKQAKQFQSKVIAITGFSGGRVGKLADINVHIPSRLGDYGPVEDIQLSICHMITEMWRSL
jgi:D-sedoheptulose 7-phosphate isomerase